MNIQASSRSHPVLRTASGEIVPLQGLEIDGHLENARAQITLTQRYRNRSERNIEAVYTFPLPVQAVLLGLTVTLGGRTLVGRVAARQQAEAEYEQALSEGHTAVMLEQVEPGLYTLNLGNLMAGESAEIHLRYALPLRWEGDSLRLSLPTTLAPRYGDMDRAVMQPHQQPQVDALAEYPFRLALCVGGGMDLAQLSSPTHRILTERKAEGLQVRIADAAAFADRDFVLVLRSAGTSQSSCTVVPDGEAHLAHAVFRVPERAADQPLRLKLLVDCSGSMAGDSMQLAKSLAMAALDRLAPKDAFSLTAFGSTFRHHAQGRLGEGASGAALVNARSFIGALDADLGGTEMRAALEAVFGLGRSRLLKRQEPGDVLLITDGETWDREAIVAAARASGHRVFVIGVGSSPSEILARGIAEATGGFASFVAPNEDVASVIERHLQRMRLPRVLRAALRMPGELQWQSPLRLEAATFVGDTLHVFAGLRSVSGQGPAHLDLHYADGQHLAVRADALATGTGERSADTDLPRIAAAQRLWWAGAGLVESTEEELTALALQHQLMSAYTNYILVYERGDDAAQAFPELRQVPGMLAAGWGGTGSVSDQASMRSAAPTVLAKRSAAPAISVYAECSDVGMIFGSAERLRSESLSPKERRALDPATGIPDRAELEALGVPAEVLAGLEALMAQGHDEAEVILALLSALMHQTTPLTVDRVLRRRWLAAIRQSRPSDALVQTVTLALQGCTQERWSWSPAAIPAMAST